MKKDELVSYRDHSLMVASMWLGGLAHAKMLRDFQEKLALPNLKKVHMELFAFIDPDGTTITEIARRKGVTKQSISKTVRELLDMGFLESRENPADSRSKLLSFNLQTGSMMRRSFAVLAEIDQMIAETIGAEEYRAIQAGVDKVIRTIEAEDPAWTV